MKATLALASLALLLVAAPARAKKVHYEEDRPTSSASESPSDGPKLGLVTVGFGLSMIDGRQDLGYRIIRRRATGLLIPVHISVLAFGRERGIKIGPIRIADDMNLDIRAGGMSSDKEFNNLWFGARVGIGGQGYLTVSDDIELGGRLLYIVDIDSARANIGDGPATITTPLICGRARYTVFEGEGCLGQKGIWEIGGAYRVKSWAISGAAVHSGTAEHLATTLGGRLAVTMSY